MVVKVLSEKLFVFSLLFLAKTNELLRLENASSLTHKFFNSKVFVKFSYKARVTNLMHFQDKIAH